jgi:hypothetical protein
MIFVPEDGAFAHLARTSEDHDRVLGDGSCELWGEPAG